MSAFQLALLKKSSANVVDEVSPGLYVGDLRAVYEIGTLSQKHDIHRVISVVSEVDVGTLEGVDKHLVVAIADNEEGALQLLDALQTKVFPFVDDEQSNHGSLLVHCVEGKSRSVVVAMAILMHKNGTLSVDDALSNVKKHRRIANPHPALLAVLRDNKL
jgi:protein-tyrosine phosphatase